MYKEFFVRSPLLALPLVSLVIFLAVFAAVLLSVLRRRAVHYAPASRLPLAADDNEARHVR